jgi:hypothetical protein
MNKELTLSWELTDLALVSINILKAEFKAEQESATGGIRELIRLLSEVES